MQLNNEIRVLVSHDDPIMAAGLVAVLGQQPDLYVENRVADAGFGAAVDVVVADYQSGLKFLAASQDRVQSRGAGAAKVLLVTPLDRELEIRSAMKLGVHGFVLQGCKIEELTDAVRMLGRGARYLCDAVANCMADSLARESLTAREADVLQLLSEGLCNKSIAKQLGVAVGTVKAHVKNILQKLEATTRTHAVVVAARRGLVSNAPSNVAAGERLVERAAALA